MVLESMCILLKLGWYFRMSMMHESMYIPVPKLLVFICTLYISLPTGDTASIEIPATPNGHEVVVVEETDFSCSTFLPCDPTRWMHRFLLLFLMCSLSFGSYYVYDNPAALQRTIMNVRIWIMW